MKVIIHRGTREIGGSCIEISTASTRLIFDLGMPLVAPWNKTEKLDSSGYPKMSARELLDLGVLPPVAGLYDHAGDSPVTAVVLSHPHQDHYGLLGHIRRDLPVYLSDGARRIIAASDIFLPLKAKIQHPVVVEDRRPVVIGDITVTPYLVDHSAFAAMSFLVEGEGARVFYSGDFRAHGRKWKLFPKFLRSAPQGVDCLLMEGTTLGRPEQRMETEAEVEGRIVEIARRRRGIKLIYASGQNVDRLVSFYKAAQATGGQFVVDLYTAYMLEALGHASIPTPSAAFPRMRVLYTKYLMRKIAASGMRELFARYRPFEIDAREIARAPGKHFVMYRESLTEDVEAIGDFSDSVLIYSLYEGYRREASFQKVQAFLDNHGIAIESAHTSGHAGASDLKKLAEALKPRVLVPIHTFEPGKYAGLWGRIQTLADGEALDLSSVPAGVKS